MAKLTLTDLTQLSSNETAAVTAINNNNAAIEAALENTHSLDGTTPNTMTDNFDLNSNKVINVADPTNNQDAVTKKYGDDNYGGAAATAAAASAAAAATSETNAAASEVASATSETNSATSETNAALSAAAAQAAAAGIKWKDSAKAATTANITLSGEQTIDAVALVAGDTVLVKNQTASEENGIYDVSATGWTRNSYADTWAKLVSMAVTVEEGSVNKDLIYICTVDDGGTLGTTPISFTGLIEGVLRAVNNLSDVASAATSFSNIKQAATDAATGVVELATQAEVDAGTDTARVVTPNTLANYSGLGGGSGYGSIQVFTASGTWTKPANLVRAEVIVIGGGGGGGGTSSNTIGGAGAGGGGASIELIETASLGATETVTVGAGGTGVSGAGGNSGGTTSFGSLLQATGGAGAGLSGSAAAAGGAGGVGSGGDLNIQGGPGEAGNIGTADATDASGGGGNTILGGGGNGVTTQSNGTAGGAYGGGGGGGKSTAGGATAGGNGADGVVIVKEYF